MNVLNYSAIRQNFAKAIERVCADHDPLVVTRQKRGSVVIISLEDYEAMEETANLLRSPRNAKRLMESIVQLEGGKGRKRSLAK